MSASSSPTGTRLVVTFALALLSLAPRFATAHIALWHPSMFGYDPNDGNQQEPVTPLAHMDFKDWWLHGYIDKPPQDGKVMELPAGGVFHGEVACNKAWTSQGTDPTKMSAEWSCDSTGAMHTADEFATANPKDVKGCALAIAYTSDVHALTPEEMVVISVNYECPWKKNVDFEIPSDLPACPEGGCLCTWNWVHAADAGSEQIYNLGYRCNVTGATSTQPLTTTPKTANKCDYPNNVSNCTVGAKAPHYWLQNERNNCFQDTYDPPFYNGAYGFRNGAQLDLFAGVGGETTVNATASASATAITAASSTALTMTSSSSVITSSASSVAPAVTSNSTPTNSTTTSSGKICRRGLRRRGKKLRVRRRDI